MARDFRNAKFHLQKYMIRKDYKLRMQSEHRGVRISTTLYSEGILESHPQDYRKFS